MKKILLVLLTIIGLVSLSGCSIRDTFKDFESDTVGIDRICTIYYPDGETKEIEGRIRMYPSETGASVLHISLDGKRQSYFNIGVECIEQ
jgi:hypothetical protein